MIGRNRTAPSAGHLFGLYTLQRPLSSQVHLCLATAAPWFGQTYDTEYVVCHRPFSHPPLFSISFVGASYFQRTQLYLGFGFQMRGFFGFILRPPRACAHSRPRHRRGVGERPHVRWSVERTASPAVAKPRCSGGQTRWTCELSGLCKVYKSEKVASGRCSPISTNHVALFGLSCTRLGLVSTLHLALAIFQQGAPCFGHCPNMYSEKKTGMIRPADFVGCPVLIPPSTTL